MKKKIFLFLLSSFLLYSILWAEPTKVRNIFVERLLEKTRITISADKMPNFSTFLQTEPPAIVVDLFDATSKLEQETLEIFKYGVKKIVVEEEPPITKIFFYLDSPYHYTARREGNLILVDVSPEIFETPVEEKLEEKTVSMDVKDADIVDVLRMLAAIARLNIIASPEVRGTITMRLEKVSFSIAFEAILRAVGCNAVKMDERVIMVKPRKVDVEGELHTRIYTLDYTEADDMKKAVDKALSEKGKAEIAYRRVGEGGGSKRTALLIVHDLPERLEKIDEVIAELDKPPPQISIEAKFIETTVTADEIYGIDWSLRVAATAAVPDFGEEVALPIMINHFVIGKLSFAEMSAALELLQLKGKARLLANPRTVTLDNQKAEIKMGVAIPLLETRIDPETRERTYTWRERFIPIQLIVTPHLTNDGNITMEVMPMVEAIIGWKTVMEEDVPIIAKREAKTQVAIKDGEVIAIGGLVKEEETRTESKVPILGSIPILGNLFKRTSIKKEQNELIIFIIPRVVRTEG